MLSLTSKSWRSSVCSRCYWPTRHVSSSVKPDSKPKTQPIAKQEEPLKFLSRPLGVLEPPTIIEKTWTESRNELMDQDVRLAQRHHIIKEATKGYFTDLNRTRRHGGKTWIAPGVMIREDKSLYFPNVTGTSLEPKEKKYTTIMGAGRVSVIAMLSSRISEIHVDGFAAGTNKAFKDHPSYQYIQINLQENLLKSMLVSLFLSSIKRTVPPHLHSTYLVSSQNLEYVREPLGMVNRHVGYVYLVDENLRIRWAGCADAKPEEASALQSCTQVLLDRLDKKAKN